MWISSKRSDSTKNLADGNEDVERSKTDLGSENGGKDNPGLDVIRL